MYTINDERSIIDDWKFSKIAKIKAKTLRLKRCNVSRHVATQFPGVGSWPWNVYECGPQALVHVRRVPYPIALILALALTLRTTFFDRRNPRLANSSDTLRATFSIWVHPDGLFSTRNQPIGVRENSPTFTNVPPLFFLYSNLMVGQMSSHWGVVSISILFKIFSSSIWSISHILI